MDELSLTQGQKVFSFPAGKSFVDLLALFLLKRYGDNPFILARTLVLLPSRRACLALRDAFLRASDGAPLLLPRMQPISDVDEDGMNLESWAGGDEALPPAISRSLRHVLLTQIIARSGLLRTTHALPEQAALMAAELMRLLDDMARAEIGFSGLRELVPEELASHWQITLDFLTVIERQWLRVLDDEGVMEPLARRNLLLRELTARWTRNPPGHPVIAAGSTGSQSATAELLAAVAGLPQGMVILPGLDREMEKEEWELLDESHPQYGMKQLLEHLGMARGQVVLLDDAAVAGSAPARLELLRRALQPAELTATWRAEELDIASATAGLARMDCENAREEAAAIALKLREVLETPGRRAALVTPDRQLARRVAAAMRRWGVQLDDSAGRPLWQTPPGTFLRLVAQMALAQAAPVPLLSLLKHPLAALGMDTAECRRMARLLERQLLRGVRPAAGIAALHATLARDNPPGAERIGHVLDSLQHAAGEFMREMQKPQSSFEQLLQAHLRAAESLADTRDEKGAQRLWAGDDGADMAKALAELALAAGRLGSLEPHTYPGLLEALLEGTVTRTPYGTHPRLHILSPIEARLQHFDVVILAGLNEGVWPRLPEPSPWMSRPMQKQFGLKLPEEAVGKSAHDFYLLAAAPEVLLTRAQKAEGTATTPSRWLLRLDTLLSAMQGSAYVWPQAPYAQWVRAQETPQLAAHAQPAPCPPVSSRPRMLRLTEVETWQRDPYMIYARHILGLRKLDALDEEPSIREFGMIVHAALDAFARKYPHALPEDAEKELLALGEAALEPLADRPAVLAYWRPRFAAAVPWVIAQERIRREQASELRTEYAGELQVDGLTLKTRIDRLELHGDGTFSLVDYKNGALPKPKEIEIGLAVQMPLEALVVRDGAMEDKPAVRAPRSMTYWKLAGRKNEILNLDDPQALCAKALARLHELIEAFAQEDMPYLATPDAQFAPRYNDYEHLERREEWEWQESA